MVLATKPGIPPKYLHRIGVQIIMRKWIDTISIFEEIRLDFDGFLYHATSIDNIEGIYKQGIKPVSYWGVFEIAAYYADGIEEDGQEPHIFKLPISDFDPSLLEPDYPGLQEPLVPMIGMPEDEIWDKWERSEKTWRVSLELIGSVRYRGVIKT